MIPPPEIAPGSSSPALADPRRLGEAQQDAALRHPAHLRDLRGQHLLPAGHRQRLRPAGQAPDLPRPYRTWGYPFTPLLYVAAALLLLGNMLVDDQSRVQSLVGLGLILLGIPAWAILRRRGPER